jgi:plasmid replication initiation protein
MENELKEKNMEPNAIVFARQNFTPLQKDIFTLAVSQLETGFNVQPDLFKNKTVSVSVKMLSEVTGKNYQRLRQECKDLALKVLEISDDEKEEFHFIVPFPEIKYKKGVIELTMFSSVVQSFLELKNGYAEYYIRESLSLEEFNKKRLYEILSSYKKRIINTWTVYDSELKKLLGMDIENDPYKSRHKQFAERIIAVCINAINDKTSIAVTYTRKKDTKGWYTSFEVADKNKKQLSAKESPKRDEKTQKLYEKLKGIHVREDVINTILQDPKLKTDSLAWFYINQSNLATKAFKSDAGVLLVHLGLAQAKKK